MPKDAGSIPATSTVLFRGGDVIGDVTSKGGIGGKIAQQAPPYGQLGEVDARLRAAQVGERRRAELRLELNAHLLELRHFEDYLTRQKIPELQRLPLLHRSSERIMDFLAETQLDLTAPLARA